MKIAYLSNYREISGYSQAALGYILALDRVGVTVAPRNVYLQNPSKADKQFNNEFLPPRIAELEQNDLRNCDFTIFHTLPHLASPNNKSTNVLMFAVESSDFRNSTWVHYCNNPQFKGLITFCKNSTAAIKNSGVNKRILSLPHAVWPLHDKVEPIMTNNTNTCVFLYNGEWSPRKNVEGLIKTYYHEFNSDENVLLVIKTFVSGKNQQEAEKFIANEMNEIKRKGKLAKYPQTIVINDRLSPLQMARLYKSASYTITTSHMEGFGLPTFEGLAYDIPFIAPNYGPFQEYLKESCGYFVNVNNGIVYDVDGPEGLYSIKELWHDINSISLATKMREAFDCVHTKRYENMVKLTHVNANHFTLGTVGQQLKSILEKI